MLITLFLHWLYLIWGVALMMHLWGTWLVLRRRPQLNVGASLEPVSVLKPLKGIDAGLEENLESFFQQNYPDFELLFCVQCATDPSLEIIQRLSAKYPMVPHQIIISASSIGLNPKINNMIEAYERSRNDVIVISDSNVRVGQNYLVECVQELNQKNCGVVTSIVVGESGTGLGGQLESIFLNTFYARWMLLSSALGFPCVIGKSMVFRKSTALRFGGLEKLSSFLAEDYVLGRAITFLGQKISIARMPIRQHIGKKTVREFWQRHVRWGRLRRFQAPLAYAGEPCLTLQGSMILLTSALLLDGRPLFPLILVHLFIWFSCDFLLELKWKTRSLSKVINYIPLWLLREVAAVPLWIHIGIGHSVQWRGEQYFLKSGGLLFRRTKHG